MSDWIDLDEDVASITSLIENLPEHLQGEVFARTLVEHWGNDVGKTVSLLNYSKKLAMQQAVSKGEVKDRLPYEIHEYLYKVILEQGVSPEEAVTLATEMFDCTEGWINEKKILSCSNQVRLITRSFDNHKKQRSIKDKGVLTSKDLKTTTPNAQLKRLHKGVVLYDWVKGLEGKVVSLEDKIESLEAVTSINTKAVSNLENILGGGVSLEDKIKDMKGRGLSQKKVAELLEVSVRTVQRKWKTL